MKARDIEKRLQFPLAPGDLILAQEDNPRMFLGVAARG
jgi:hypothetical protein